MFWCPSLSTLIDSPDSWQLQYSVGILPPTSGVYLRGMAETPPVHDHTAFSLGNG